MNDEINDSKNILLKLINSYHLLYNKYLSIKKRYIKKNRKKFTGLLLHAYYRILQAEQDGRF